MLYKYDGKIYIKPLSNKMAEVKVSKKNNDYDIEIIGKLIYITPDIRNKMVQVTQEQAYKAKANI